MKRFPITPEDKLFLKSIEKYAVVILLMFKIHPCPVDAESLAFEMKWDQRTAKTKLDGMSSDGLTALVKGEGYVLTGRARSLFTDFMTDVLLVGAEEKHVLAQSPALGAGTSTNAQAQISAPNEENSTNCVPHTLCSLKKIEEEDGFVKLNSSSSVLDAQNVQKIEIVPEVVGLTFEDGTPIYSMFALDGSLITVRDILDATEVIEDFGDIVLHGLPLDAIKPEIALGWVAQACNSKRLDVPAALVYSRLVKRDKPKPAIKYLYGPARFLPDEYCARLKIEKYDCKSCVSAKFSTRTEYEAHVREIHSVVVQQDVFEPAEVFPMPDPQSIEVRAWEAVKGDLQVDMPRASYDTWVQDTQAVVVDGQRLTVAVRNSYARDWLESRLQDKVETILRTCTHGSILSVKFVVGSIDESFNGDENG